MASLVITCKTKRPDPQTKIRSATADVEAGLELAHMFKQAATGQDEGLEIDLQYSSVDPVAASGTLTVVSAIATDAITIGTITLVATSTPTTDLHFEIDGADDAADAASLCAAINANPTLSKVVAATVAENVVTVAALQKGLVGNFIPMTSADATITASGSGFLAGGTGGAASSAVQVNLGHT
jgi:phage tail sheath gpL-like